MEQEENKNYCTMYLVRHGETEWNVQHITQGQLNSPLTELGIQQAHDTAKDLKDIHFDAIFSSDLTRAQDTAEIIKLDREIIIQTSDTLRERNFGKFESKHADDFKESLKDKINERERLSEAESWTFKLAEDIETDEEVATRFILKLREISVAYPNKTVLVVSHGGPIRMFLAKVGYAPKAELKGGAFKNAGYVKVASDGVNFFIKEIKGLVKTQGTVIYS